VVLAGPFCFCNEIATDGQTSNLTKHKPYFMM